MSPNHKHILVDGYNVIRRTPAWAETFRREQAASREALIAHCAAWRARRQDVRDVTIVFDGDSTVVSPSSSRVSGINVVFTATDEEADHRILRRVEKSESSQFVVITDDAALARACLREGAEVMAAQAFRQVSLPKSRRRRGSHVAEPEKTGLTPQQRREIDDDLKREFGLE